MIRRILSNRRHVIVAKRHYKAVMSSSEAILETLSAHKVNKVFGIVGSAFMNILHSFPTANIDFVSVQHEQNAVHMADGYARSTGDCGVCISQNGPGITNMVTGVATAFNAHSPVVIITPQASNKTMGLGMFQEIDQMPMFSNITKYQVQVNDQSRISDELSNCLHYSKLYNGPTQLNIPRELLYGVPMEYSINGPKNIDIRTPANPKLVSSAADLLYRAKNPVILVGGGVNSEFSRTQVIRLAEHLGCGVVSTYLHNDAFPCDHHLYTGSIGYMGSLSAMKLISEADLVLSVGTRLSTFGLLPQYNFNYWPENAKIIQIDVNADAVGKTKNIDIGLIGDSGLVCEQLMMETYQCNIEKYNENKMKIHKLNKEWKSYLEELTNNTENYNNYLPARKALRTIFNNLPDDAIVSTDIGNICSLTNSYVKFKNPRSFLAAMTFGSCGTALPTAMGAKIANPDKPCISISGDGAWGMSFHELQTAIRLKLRTISIVFNNSQWGAEKKNQIIWFGDRYIGTNLKNPDFAEIALVMGAKSYKCYTEQDVFESLGAALKIQDRPVVIEIMTTRELTDPFRRDAMKLPTRELDKYKKDVIMEESLTGQPTDIME